MHGYKWPINCTRTRTVASAGGMPARTDEAARLREQAQAEAAAIVAAAHADAARLADEDARARQAQQAQQEADALLAAARLEAAQIRGAAVASAPPPPPPRHTSVAAAVQVRETVVVRHGFTASISPHADLVFTLQVP